MKKLFVLFSLLTSVLCFAVIEETAAFKDFLYGNTDDCEYDNWVSHIAEGIADEGYNYYAPYDVQKNGFGDFRLPSEDELFNWDSMIELFVQGNTTFVQMYIDNFDYPYQVVEFNDTETGEMYYMLREVPDWTYNDDNETPDYPADDEYGAFDWGWGLYLFNPNAQSPIVITCPHPNDDFTTAAIGYECFKAWDARYLLINGSGREVEWTNVDNYTNSKSLSDPSRRDDHPFTVTYKKFCDEIRETFGKKELSVQIHGYDWNRHAGHPNLQLSAGYNRGNPNLPIRDLSDLKIDVVNNTPHTVFRANTIGSHQPVYTNDYYGVFHYTYDFTYSNPDTTFAVSNRVDLSGYSQNRQMLYSSTGMSHWDVLEPFFHIEMDELPDAYDQTLINYRWFYAYDPISQTYDMDHVFDNTIEYFTPFINSVAATIQPVFEFDDGLVPDVPMNLNVTNSQNNRIRLEWEYISSFDFKTYEILYADEPIGDDNYSVYDRYNDGELGSPRATEAEVTGLNPNTEYFFQVRALDYNGNYSELSEEVNTVTGPVRITSFKAVGNDANNVVSWTASTQIDNLGFIIYRRFNDEEFVEIDSHENNFELMGSTDTNVVYIYSDDDVMNDEYYTYQISAVNTDYEEFFYGNLAQCSPRRVFTINARNVFNTVSDETYFSINPFASDGNDSDYDVATSVSSTGEYLFIGFWEYYWGSSGTNLEKEVHGLYDLDNSYKTWDMRIKTNQLSQNIFVEATDFELRNSEKLFLKDSVTDEIIDLSESNYVFQTSSTGFRDFTLYWGNIQPSLSIIGTQNKILQAGTEFAINWTRSFDILLENCDIYLENDEGSLLIAEDVTSDASSFIWVIPDNVTMLNSKIRIDVLCTDGEEFSRYSNYTLGIVPLDTEQDVAEGWRHFANPFTNGNIYINQVFSTGVQAFKYSDEFEYVSDTSLNYGTGYWLYNPEEILYSNDGNIRETEDTIEMHPGWNLIPNPFLTSFETKDLKFDFFGSTYTFGEMLEYELLSGVVYVYRDGAYEVTETINPFESYCLYSYYEEPGNLSVRNTPFYRGYDIEIPNGGWEVWISAEQNGADADEIVVGSCEYSTNGYNFRYDLPEPPEKPFVEGLEMYLTHNGFPHSRLNQEYIETLDADEPDEFWWEFELDFTELDEITFQSAMFDFPDDYNIYLRIDNQQANLSDGETLTILPMEGGPISGEVLVQNEHLSSDDVTAVRIELKNYPNPFNPETKISFNVVQTTDTSLIIYNIKGQKVKTLVNEKLFPANYTFNWNGTDSKNNSVASGMYFYQLKSGSETQTKKMILLK
jgi:hypothetical protein